MRFPEISAFAEESAAIDATLARVAGEDWHRRGLGEWIIKELVAHLLRAASLISTSLDLPAVGPVAHDRVSYFQFDLAAEAPAIAKRARNDAASGPPTELPTQFGAAWQDCVRRAASLPPDHRIATRRGTMRLDEYTATRVLELVVHHMDLRMALDLPPTPTPAAGLLTMRLLEGLLGSPRPHNLGRTRFILVATGRIPTDDPRFPVLE